MRGLPLTPQIRPAKPKLLILGNLCCISQISILMKEFGLYEARNKSVKKYSLGVQQKLGIIQAITGSPDVVVLDEPFNALDESSLEFVKQKLLDIKKAGNATIIIASHDKSIVDELCDEIIHMSNP